MLLQSNPSLDERIVQLLARHGYCSAKELQAYLGGQRRGYSLPGVYKVLRRMTDDGVILRVGDKFGLSFEWITHVNDFTTRLNDTYYRTDSLANLVDSQHKAKMSWTFTNLLRLKIFWSQLVVALLKRAPSPVLLSWNPHPWFYLVQAEHERKVLDELRRARARMFKIVAGKTPFDFRPETVWKNAPVTYSIGKNPFGWEQRRYFSIVGSALIQVRLRPSTVERIEDLFQTSKKQPVIHAEDTLHLFSDKHPAKLSLELHSAAAARITKQYETYFGPLRRVE